MDTAVKLSLILLVLYFHDRSLVTGALNDESAPLDCSQVQGAITNTAGNDTSPIYETLLKACSILTCSKEEKRTLVSFAEGVSDYISENKGNPEALQSVKKMIEEYILNISRIGLRGLIENASVVVNGPSPATVTILQFFTCVDNVTDSCNSTGRMVVGQSDVTPLYEAIRDACLNAISPCTLRDDKQAVAKLASDVAMNMAAENNTDVRIKAAEKLINDFLANPALSDIATDAVRSAIIPGFSKNITKFLICASQITAPTNPPKLIDRCSDATTKFLNESNIEEGSELYKTLDAACYGKCNYQERKDLEKLAGDVSIIIYNWTSSEMTKLDNITTTIRNFLSPLAEDSTLKNAVLNAELAGWGNISEFLKCKDAAFCAAGIEEAFNTYEQGDDWCLLLEAVEYCTDCDRTDRAVSMQLADQIHTAIANKAVDEKSKIAVDMLKALALSADAKEAAVAAKIYDTMLGGWGSIQELNNCVP